MNKIIEQVVAYVKQHHAEEYSGHDFEHVKRVWSLAKKIAASEQNVDLYTVELAALLHDVDDYKLGHIGTHHAADLMRRLSVDENILQNVLYIIDSIGFSKSGYAPNLTSIEAKIVYDADKLDGIGAIGIARAFAYGGNKNRIMFNPNKFPTKFDLSNYKHNSLFGGDHSVNHFFDKLLNLSRLLQTRMGRELAQQRQQTMLMFLKDFFDEQELSDWQDLLNAEIA